MNDSSSRLGELEVGALRLAAELRADAASTTEGRIGHARAVRDEYRQQIEQILTSKHAPAADAKRILDAACGGRSGTEVPSLRLTYGAVIAQHVIALTSLADALLLAEAGGRRVVDVERVLRACVPQQSASWRPDDVITYHLGIGAGATPTRPSELRLTYEADLRVLPTFATTRATDMLFSLSRVEGFNFKWENVLHSEHDLEIPAPLPPTGQVTTTGRVTNVYDKGKFAVVVLEATSCWPNGSVAFVNRYSLVMRGAGGPGGERGPEAGNTPPGRAPDLVVERRTLPQQALLYRLSGDRNPLHADPEFAAAAGYERPILHGLCVYGIVSKAVVDELLDGDPARVARVQARFAGETYPGETLVVKAWLKSDRVLVVAGTKERGTPVISNAAITLR